MTVTAHSLPGDKQDQNEDWYIATDDVVIVLDGATIRTDTGCVHGLPWFVHQLGGALLVGAQDRGVALPDVLADAIGYVAALHADTCDLHHPGTPSAAVGIVRRSGDQLEWLVLGDITVMVQADRLHVESDERVSSTGVAERRECDRHPIGSPEKLDAILAMKEIELASRNVDGGYWIASMNPEAAKHALTGRVPVASVIRFAVCSDGAMRALTMTAVDDHAAVMDVLRHGGPTQLVNQVRQVERTDPTGQRLPRNKATDDATAVLVQVNPAPAFFPPWTDSAAAQDLMDKMNDPELFGALPASNGKCYT